MNDYDRILDILGAVAGIVALAWIGLSTDIAKVKDLLANVRKNSHEILPYVRLLNLFGPYALFIFTAIILISQSLRIEVSNSVKTIQADDRPPIQVQNELALFSSADDFHIIIKGSIAAEDARLLIRRYGQAGKLKVFATVSQSEPWFPDGLIWVQGKEWGVLGLNGDYTVEAYLGGIGVDAAKEGQTFPVRIYIPKDQGIDFFANSQYKNTKHLPKPVFLSDPLYVKCLRQDPAAKVTTHGATLLQQSPSQQSPK